ncbi:MAG: undecaprenyl-diphosphate phosphatase [Pirellulales bacterium]
MTVPQAIALGVVEGITEYLPVSSTGHLLLAQRGLGLGMRSEEEKTAAHAFAVCIQFGAILAVLGLYRRRVWDMLRGVVGKDVAGRRLAWHVVLGVCPAIVAGLLLEKPIKRYLFGGGELGLWPVVAAWIVGGLAILVVSRWRGPSRLVPEQGRDLSQLTWRRALFVGSVQCLALWPGVSRSLATIVGGSLAGLRLPAAVEFSFLLGLVTLGGATVKDAWEYGPLMVDLYGLPPLLAGTAAAAVAAAAAVTWMVGYLSRHGMQLFGYYRLAIGTLVAVLLLLDVL